MMLRVFILITLCTINVTLFKVTPITLELINNNHLDIGKLVGVVILLQRQ